VNFVRLGRPRFNAQTLGELNRPPVRTLCIAEAGEKWNDHRRRVVSFSVHGPVVGLLLLMLPCARREANQIRRTLGRVRGHIWPQIRSDDRRSRSIGYRYDLSHTLFIMTHKNIHDPAVRFATTIGAVLAQT
jgi:hypothetical protein